METTIVSRTITLVIESCINCGVVFALDAEFREQLKESHRTWYCPNGHAMRFLAENEKERLARQLKLANDDKNRLGEMLRQKEVELSKLNTRIANGVCLHCRRNFTNLRRHMASKHGKAHRTP